MYPTSLFVATTGDIYIGNDYKATTPPKNWRSRISKWSLSTKSFSIILGVDKSCTGLFIDANNTLYCSMTEKHQVVKKSLNDNVNTSITAAGTGQQGLQANKLQKPYGIFVDIKFHLYVADCGNDRIQRFKPGQLNGTTVVGSTAPETTTLKCPTGIVLDADGYIFIVDSKNNRIVGSGAHGFRCLVGCSTKGGSESHQLHNPRGLSFDSSGNIFVVDWGNSRIQKFTLAKKSCGKYDVELLDRH
jgi:sugar lactone lactonase YvrE